MEKFHLGDSEYDYPIVGGTIRIPLHSHDKKEEFSLDIRRSSIEMKKNTFQNRVKKTIVLLRLDIGGSPHRNPDGEELPCPHIHIFQEGFNDKWAYSVPNDKFSNLNCSSITLNEFMDLCNIVKKPFIKEDLLI